MERLTFQPYSIRRVSPNEALSFTVDDTTAIQLTTLTHKALQSQGRLFYVDYRNQGNLVLTSGRSAAASEAYFYIHPTKNQFLPLAIRLNRGSSIVYTPLDSFNDWTLAKMYFELNDFWFTATLVLISFDSSSDIILTLCFSGTTLVRFQSILFPLTRVET
jgi:arachidonate 15-lipoxygenase (second type) / 8-lipoxygenase (S-type)